MPERNQAVLDFLLTRRSRPAKTLSPEAPPEADIRIMLTAASRTPDHGKLEPFRFIVFRGAALARLSRALASYLENEGEDPEKIKKHADGFLHGGAIVAVVSSPKPSEKIPAWEQQLAAGGACLALLNAALALGWGANWLTGRGAGCRAFLERDLGLSPEESIAGFIHLGAATTKPPERPRPDIDAIADWRDT